MNNSTRYNSAWKATWSGIVDLFKTQTPIGTLSIEDRLDGYTCLISGANSGLGFATAIELAKRGATLYMACRSGIPQAGEQVIQASGNPNVYMLSVDLSEKKSIDNFLDSIEQKQLAFDIVICNAAIVPSGSRQNSDGLDQMFMVNYLSTYKLVRALIERKLLRTTPQHIPRIIFVSSESHRSASNFDASQLGIYTPYTMGKVISLYGYYKLLMNMFANSIHQRYNTKEVQLSIHALCPGPVNSNIAREAPRIFQPLLKGIFSLFFNSPEKACQPVVYLSCSKAIEGKSMIYLHLMQQKEMDERTKDEGLCEILWEKSNALL